MRSVLFRWGLVVLLMFALVTMAQAVSTDALTVDVTRTFQASLQQWQQPIQAAALRIFWLLSLASLAFGLALLAVSGSFELGAMIFETIRWILFTGFWLWVLTNAPQFFQTIVQSLWRLGGQAGGVPDGMDVSGIVDLGLQIYRMDAGGPMDLLHLGQSFAACLAGLVALLMGGIMAVNAMLIVCGGWIVAYAGSIVAGMTSRWTLDLGVGYLRMALAYGLRAMTANLVTGLGLALLQRIISQVGNPPNISEVALLTLAMFILAALATILPWQVGHLAGGGGFFGGALGFGAAWMAARIASQVVSRLSGQGGAAVGSKGGAQKSSVERASDHGDALIAQGYGNRKRSGGNGNGSSTNGGGGSRP